MSDFIGCKFILPRKKFKKEMIEQIVEQLSKFEEVMTEKEWVKRYHRDLKSTHEKEYLQLLEDTKHLSNWFRVIDCIRGYGIEKSLGWDTDKKAPKETIDVRLSGDARLHSPLNFLGDELLEEVEKEKQELALTATENFVRDAKIIYDIIHPDYGFSYLTEASAPTITEKELKESIFWVNFYGPAMAERIGKQKLLTAPAYKVEELKDGGVFLRLNENWLDLKWGVDEYACLKRYIAVAKHLGLNKLIQGVLEHCKNHTNYTKEYQEEIKKIVEEIIK